MHWNPILPTACGVLHTHVHHPRVTVIFWKDPLDALPALAHSLVSLISRLLLSLTMCVSLLLLFCYDAGVLGTKPKALHILGKPYASELYPLSIFFSFLMKSLNALYTQIELKLLNQIYRYIG